MQRVGKLQENMTSLFSGLLQCWELVGYRQSKLWWQFSWIAFIAFVRKEKQGSISSFWSYLRNCVIYFKRKNKADISRVFRVPQLALTCELLQTSAYFLFRLCGHICLHLCKCRHNVSKLLYLEVFHFCIGSFFVYTLSGKCNLK